MSELSNDVTTTASCDFQCG